MFNKCFFFESRAAYEIMRKNMINVDRPQKTVSYGACAWRAR